MLADLAPGYYVRGNGRGCLTIDCPLCGPSHRFTVPTTLGPAGEASGIKRWNITGAPPAWDTVSISPSVALKERCCWHGTITQGNVDPSSQSLRSEQEGGQ